MAVYRYDDPDVRTLTEEVPRFEQDNQLLICIRCHCQKSAWQTPQICAYTKNGWLTTQHFMFFLSQGWQLCHLNPPPQ